VKNLLLHGVRQQLDAMEKSGAVLVMDRDAAELALAGCLMGLVAGMQGQSPQLLAMVYYGMVANLNEMIAAQPDTPAAAPSRLKATDKGGLN
jgi:hypothetical protein